MTRRTRIVLILSVIAVALATTLGLLAWPHTDTSGHTSSPLARGYHFAALTKMLLDGNPDNILVLLQNSTELRPTGGFLTAIGEGTVVGGQLTELTVSASDVFDDTNPIKVPLPEGLAGRISTDRLELRDANWDVDFPTSAANVLTMYNAATGKSTDIVIGITTTANELLLAQLGSISFEVNGYTLTVDATNVTATLEHYTDVAFAELGLTINNRKEVLASYAASLMPRLKEYVSGNWRGTMTLLSSLVASYDLQAWSPDADVDAHLAALDTRQQLRPDIQTDHLLIVHANVGAYKTDPFIERTASYVVTGGAETTATLSLNYHNTSTLLDPLTKQYGTYVRVYVPHQSTLTGSTGLQEVTVTVRHGYTVISGWLVIPQGQERAVELSYTLPGLVDVTDYALLLERQPGVAPYPVAIKVSDGSTTYLDTTIQTSRDVIVRGQK